MKTIFSIKSLSGNPADGIDNVNIAGFGNISASSLVFLVSTPADFAERGCIKKMSAKTAWQKIRLMRKIQPEYLFGNGSISDIPFILLKPRKTRYVIDWHTALMRRTEGQWRVRTPWFLRSFVFNRAWVILCVSEYIASTVRAYFPHKNTVVILNGVDTELFSADDPAIRKPNQAVFVGTLEPRKRPDIVCALALAMPEVEFVFVGRDRAPWQYARDIQEIPNARWVPLLSRAEVAALLRESALFVFPSINEPAAAVILEAMASGCVPIVSKSGGNGEFFDNGVSGYAVPCGAGEQEAFMEAIKKLVTDDASRDSMARVARSEAGRHSWRIVAQAYADFFK